MATSESTTNKRVLEEFIEMYRTHPCLWQVKNKDYHDRDKKEAAYKLLIAKLREIEPDANKATVVKKNNNMRSNVRKEKRNTKNLSSLEQVLMMCTILNCGRYYDLFNFLNDQCTPRESSSNLEDDNSSDGANTQDSSVADQQNSSTPNSEITDNKEDQSTSSNKNSSRPPKPKRKDETIANELLESVRDHFKRPRPNSTEDRCDIIGKNVAMKLRALDAKQISIAEKLINDLLFEAELGNLTPEHAYISMRDVLGKNRRRHFPAEQYRQQVYYQSSPSSNRTYTPVSFVSSGSPSPPSLPIPSSQHSEHLSQYVNQRISIPQDNPYSTNLGNQLGDTEVLTSIPEQSAASFFNNFNDE